MGGVLVLVLDSRDTHNDTSLDLVLISTVLYQWYGYGKGTVYDMDSMDMDMVHVAPLQPLQQLYTVEYTVYGIRYDK